MSALGQERTLRSKQCHSNCLSMMTLFFSTISGTPECELKASALELRELGVDLCGIEINRTVDVDPILDGPVGTTVLRHVEFAIEDYDDDKIGLNVVKDTLLISGTRQALTNFGESLIEFFDSQTTPGTHLHFDYLEGHGLARPTHVSLVVGC